ncbi:8-amino-7-oxononanoate synthase [Pseudomonas sp. F1_0610]|uniref:8-amino-7-oxononanoate synthase n=1 Tax=Pseudomonas sp. F1_0610 TaxID=3114284 RepID=UPI0039C26FDD
MSFDLSARLAQQQAQHLYRQRPLLESPQGAQVIVDGKTYIAFCSNDYLGLANHPQLVSALHAGARRYGVGGGASHLVIGHSQAHHQLEEALAQLTQRPRALLFSTGYMANLAAITALVGKTDSLLHDRLNHASLLDAGILAGVRFSRYLHNDMQSLAQRLSKAQGNTLVVTDGVFSMDGDLANLPEITKLSKAHGAWCMVDDAHGLGVLGAQGGGCVEHFGLGLADVPVLVGTLGKAFGSSGAFIAGSEELIEYMIQFARPYIYTTSQSPAIACATLESLKISQAEPWRREHLKALVKQFREAILAADIPLLDSPTPIQPIIVGDSSKAMQLAAKLREQGLIVSAIRPPTVAQGSARLRITLTAAHTTAHVEQLTTALICTWQEILRES